MRDINNDLLRCRHCGCYAYRWELLSRIDTNCEKCGIDIANYVINENGKCSKELKKEKVQYKKQIEKEIIEDNKKILKFKMV